MASWHLEGVKRFITNGDFDIRQNIVHMVLARPEGAGRAPRACRCSSCRSTWVDGDGAIGERNGAVVTKVEHKMGMRGSATCELTLGDGAPCRGLLLGEVHDGIAQMFHVIEYARMGVGTKSMATLSTAYLNALDYTLPRMQGADLTKATDKTAPRVRSFAIPTFAACSCCRSVRRGPARDRAVDRAHPGPGRGRPSRQAARPASLDALNDSCCR